ncbi:MAG: sulfurtransferase TusA family protein [Gammaproteobacteria bacterium]
MKDAELRVDARRLLCPMPVIRAQDAIAPLEKGSRVRVIATDPGVLNDIPAWCRINGHTVLSSEQDELEIEILIEVG